MSSTSLSAITGQLNKLVGIEFANALTCGQTTSVLMQKSEKINSEMSEQADKLTKNMTNQSKLQSTVAIVATVLGCVMMGATGVGVMADPIASTLQSSLGFDKDAVINGIQNNFTKAALGIQALCAIGGMTTSSILAHSQYKTAGEQKQVTESEVKVVALGDASKPLVKAMDAGIKNTTSLASAANCVASEENKQNTSYNNKNR